MTQSSEHDHDHHHDLHATSYKRLWGALIINIIFLAVEIIGGIILIIIGIRILIEHLF